MNILIGFLTVVHVIVAAFMIILVLMQKSKDQGVGAAFGGGMTDTVFGAGTTTALVRMTIWCACIFLAGSLILTVLHAHRNSRGSASLMEKVIDTAPAPVSTLPAMPATPAPLAPNAPAAPVAPAAPAAPVTPAPAESKTP